MSDDDKLIEASWQRLADRLLPLEDLKDRFVASMQWSPEASEGEKSLVLGNLNGFIAFAKAAWREDQP